MVTGGIGGPHSRICCIGTLGYVVLVLWDVLYWHSRICCNGTVGYVVFVL